MRRPPSRTRAPFRKAAATAAVLTAAAAAAASLPSGSASAQNLFTNGGFETGDFSGWTLDPAATWAGMAVAVDGTPLPPSPAVLNVRTGAYAAAGGTGSAGPFKLAQTVSVLPDTLYEIGGWSSLGHDNGIAGGSTNIGDGTGNTVNVSVRVLGGLEPANFYRFRRLLKTGPDQTSATITFDGRGPTRTSWDDFYMTPRAALPAPATNTRRVLATGDPVPDGGPHTVSWIDPPLLNNAARVVTSAVSTAATPDRFLLQVDSGTRSIPVRSGAAVSGGGTLGGVSAAALNDDDGDIAFRGSYAPPGGPANVSGIFRRDEGGGISVVAVAGMNPPGGNGTFNGLFFSAPRVSNAGVAFGADLSDTDPFSSDDFGIYFRPEGGGALQTVARAGQPAPGGGTMMLGQAPQIAMNDNGAIAFVPDAYDFAKPQSFLYLYEDGTLQRIASYPERPMSWAAPVINDAGDIAIGAVGDQLAFKRIDLRHDGVYGTLLSSGRAAPGGSTFGAFGAPAINNATQVAFTALLADGTSGIFRSDAAGNVVPVVRSTQATPEGDGTFRGFVHKNASGDAPERPSINAGGQVAFVNFDEFAAEEAGIYLADPKEVVFVARWGYDVDGGTITGFRWTPGTPLQLNDFGQVAYQALLTDGRATNQLFTPTLRWLDRVRRLGRRRQLDRRPRAGPRPPRRHRLAARRDRRDAGGTGEGDNQIARGRGRQ